MSRLLRSSLVFLLLLAPVLSHAESKPSADLPNFSGYWKLDAAKSDFGGMPAPDSAGYVIRHIGAKLTFDYTQDSKTTRVDITTDGQERMTDSNEETEIWTRAYWEGPVLVFEARQRPRPAHDNPNVRWTSHWKLSPDNKVLTIERQITAPQGQLNQVLVFNRETKETARQ